MLRGDVELLKMLQGIELTQAESEVYLYLLKKGTASAGELLKASKYSRPKVYEILEKLVDLGLAESFPTRPIKFRAIDPEVAIPSLLNTKKAEIEEIENKLKSSLGRHFNKKPSGESEIFINRGLRKVSLKYCELVRNAKKQTYSFLGWVARREIDDIIDAYSAAGKKGIITNLAYFENSVFRDQIREEDVRRLKDSVVNFYSVPSEKLPIKNPPAKVLIVDEESIHITFGDYLEKSMLKDVISVHYHNIPTISRMLSRLAHEYFKLIFSGG